MYLQHRAAVCTRGSSAVAFMSEPNDMLDSAPPGGEQRLALTHPSDGGSLSPPGREKRVVPLGTSALGAVWLLTSVTGNSTEKSKISIPIKE